MPTLLDNSQTQLYQNALQTNDYTLDPGVCVLPVAQEPPSDEGTLRTWSPVVILRLHAPYRIRKLRTGTKKQNSPPIIPSPADVGKFVFVGGGITFANAMNSTNSNFDWAVETEYVYVEDCVSRNQDGFVLSSTPWVWECTEENSRRIGGTPPVPAVGAISEAGLEPLIGSFMSSDIRPNSSTGWAYNVPSFFPGLLLNDNLANGGGRTPSTGSVT